MTKRHLSLPHAFPCIDLILFLLLTMFSTWIVISRPWGLDSPSAASLSGSMYGGAALLLGNWINRIREWQTTKAETAQRIDKLKTLIAAELAQLAIGLIEAKKLMDAAIISFKTGGPVTPTINMSRYRPRPMPFAENIGSELLTLDEATLDALATLRTNLALTRQSMDEITLGANFGLIKATSISDALSHDMAVLSQTIRLIAPNRRLSLPGKKPELLTSILERAATAPVKT